MRVMGIDPGTGSMDIIVLDDESLEVLFEKAIPRVEVTRDPGIVIGLVEEAAARYRVEAIAAPSGYGIAWDRRPSREVICEATFVNKRDREKPLQIHGLRRIMEWLAESGLPVYFTPGVVQLPTVPEYRKANKIDMGTADKLFTVAAALAAEERVGDPRQSNIIVVEAGYAYNAVIAVEKGRVVDGIGGTSGLPGFLGMGSMDAELAYLLASMEPGFSRARLFEGGAHAIAGTRSLEEFADRLASGDPKALEAARLLEESVGKMVAAEHFILGRVDRVYVSGRLFRVPGMGERLRAAASRAAGAPVAEPLRLGVETKEAATGAAILASGYAGGRYRWLVDLLGVRESRGSIFDHILLEGVAGQASKHVCGSGG